MADRVIVKICGKDEPHLGPYGWPKGVVQYNEATPKPEMGPDDKDMSLDEYTAYCNFLRPVYAKWESDKANNVIDAVATPVVKEEPKHEPDTHESFEAEVLKPKKQRSKKAEK